MEESLNTEYVRDYFGGSGLGIRLACDEVPPETDPLNPEAKIFFMTGPVTATSLGTAGRYEVIFKSPLTGILCDSSSGGRWAISDIPVKNWTIGYSEEACTPIGGRKILELMPHKNVACHRCKGRLPSAWNALISTKRKKIPFLNGGLPANIHDSATRGRLR